MHYFILFLTSDSAPRQTVVCRYNNRFDNDSSCRSMYFSKVKLTSLINANTWHLKFTIKIEFSVKFTASVTHQLLQPKFSHLVRTDSDFDCARRNIESRKSTRSNEFWNRAEEKLPRKVTHGYRPKRRKGKTLVRSKIQGWKAKEKHSKNDYGNYLLKTCVLITNLMIELKIRNHEFQNRKIFPRATQMSSSNPIVTATCICNYESVVISVK